MIKFNGLNALKVGLWTADFSLIGYYSNRYSIISVFVIKHITCCGKCDIRQERI